MKNIKKRILIVTLIIALSVPESTVQAAFIPAAVTVWEALQWILLSAGVTIAGYELLQETLPDSWQDEIINSVTASLNDFQADLGTKLKSAATSASAAALTAITIAREDWLLLCDWSASIFGETSIEADIGGDASFKVSSKEEIKQIIETETGLEFQIDSYVNYFYEKCLENNAPFCVVYTRRPTNNYSDNLIFMSYFTESTITPYLFYRSGHTASGYRNIPYITVPENTEGIIGSTSAQVVNNKTFYLIPYVNTSNKLTRWADDSQIYESLYEGTYARVLNGYWNTDTNYMKILINNSMVSSRVLAKGYPPYLAHQKEENLDIVTPGTSAVDGTLTGDVVLPIPAELDDVLTGVKDGILDIPGVLEDEDIFVVPKDDTQAIEDALEKVGALNPPAGMLDKYTLPLYEFFPFCLPFDFVDFLSCLDADPVAPSYTFPMVVGYDGKEYQKEDYTISLEPFDEVAAVLRKFELFAFIIGLCFITRSAFTRS